ncbi:hypothetical protein LCI18_006755 [Fusarium solani-melongenae]|uniref:Uncharacterized protein n=1 Tax=Fusarium solani subsp. cucurbitae TaxID=2747967 RepID=A0ACD3Z3P2_FUSSC|nr:hypothetical protein LCI18_006755 [Fusarium solani-melongenae]
MTFPQPQKVIARGGPPSRYISGECEREVRIKLEPQYTQESGYRGSTHAPRLCIRCETIDLTEAVSLRPTKCSGRVIADLGGLDRTPVPDICDLCKLMHAVQPQSAADKADEDYQLRAFSSTNILLCENAEKSHKRFLTGWIDIVFIAVVPANSSADTGDYPAYPITDEATPCDKIAYGSLRSWINSCIQHHALLAACNPQSRPSIPEFRLIDCNSRKIVSPDAHVSFVALSYVWGIIPPAQGTHSGNSTSLDDTRVEPVVEDAIYVTKKLGYTHLWVDRHCIRQDNDEIQAVQLRHMNAVYQAAEVTIVAAAGNDSSFGLPGVKRRARRPQVSAEIQGHMLTVIPPDPSRLVKSSKWATRGWTYHEGLLSRRRLFFTEHEVSYECSGILCRETIALPAHILERESGLSQRLQESSWLFPREPISAFCQGGLARALLYRLPEYTARDLSRESDILNGMLGVFQVYGTLEDRPVHHLCGIPIQPGIEWRGWDDGRSLEWFANGMAWNLLKPARRRTGFPSWSWTGWKGAVAPPNSLEDISQVDLIPTPDVGCLSLSSSDNNQDSSSQDAEKGSWIEVSILEQDKPPLRWHEYETLPGAEKMSRSRAIPASFNGPG